LTDPGTVTAPELDVMVMVLPFASAAFDRLAVQVLFEFELIAAGAHCIAVTNTGAISETLAFAELPLADAVITPVASVHIAPVLTFKVTPVAPAAAVTVAGMVSGRADNKLMAEPPATAGFDRLTAQLLVVFGSIAEGVHWSAVT